MASPERSEGRRGGQAPGRSDRGALLVRPLASGAVVVLSFHLGGCGLDALLSSPPKPSAPQPTSATRLAFIVQPRNAPAGAAIVPAVKVAAQDAQGNTVSGWTGEVTLQLGDNAGGASLTGTTTRTTHAGVATFPGLSVDKAGSGYWLTARADGLASSSSAGFTITSTAPVISIVLVSGDAQTDTVAATLPAPYVVRATDGQGAPVSGLTVSWNVTGGAGSIDPAGTSTDAAGEARAIRTLGTKTGTQTVTASLSGASGSPVTFTANAQPGVPARLVFTQDPTDVAAGAIIKPPVKVAVKDQFGNKATGSNGNLEISITPLTGTPGATLSGTRARAVTAGVATFDDLSILLPGLGYRLRVKGLSHSSDSASFNVL